MNTNTFVSSLKQENENSKNYMKDMEGFNSKKISQVVSRMFYHMGKTFEDNIPLQSSNIGKKIDSKLLRKLRQKRMAQGHKRGDYGQERTDL